MGQRLSLGSEERGYLVKIRKVFTKELVGPLTLVLLIITEYLLGENPCPGSCGDTKRNLNVDNWQFRGPSKEDPGILALIRRCAALVFLDPFCYPTFSFSASWHPCSSASVLCLTDFGLPIPSPGVSPLGLPRSSSSHSSSPSGSCVTP